MVIGVPRIESNRPVQSTRRVSCAWESPSKKISPEISPPCAFKKSSNFKDLRKISPISPISPGCRGCGGALAYLHIHKETLNFTLLIYICVRKPNPRHPKRRGDFGDIGDIFGKPSNRAGLRVLGSGDILGMSPGDGDALSHARNPRNPRNPRDAMYACLMRASPCARRRIW